MKGKKSEPRMKQMVFCSVLKISLILLLEQDLIVLPQPWVKRKPASPSLAVCSLQWAKDLKAKAAERLRLSAPRPYGKPFRAKGPVPA